MYKKILSFLILSTLVISACSSSMKISTVPEGAKVYIDQEYKGVTPYVHSDQRPFWTDLNVKFVKDDYEDFNVVLRKSDGELNYGAGCGSICLLPIAGLPFSLWLFNYPEEKKFELVPKKRASNK